MSLAILLPPVRTFLMPLTENLIREWLVNRREAQGLRQTDVDRQTRAMGERLRVSQSYLSQIENGTRPFTDLGPEKMDALRRLYKVTPEEWVSKTGVALMMPTKIAVPSESEEPKQELALPEGLQAAVDLYGKRFADLREPRWQTYLAGFNWREGLPEDPEAWLDLYRDLTRAGIEPGGN